jgi:hypothetical protein
MKRLSSHMLIALLLATLCGVAGGQTAYIPNAINYQGTLTDNAGDPVIDGAYSVIFRIYDNASDGILIWSSQYPVYVNQGMFAVLLGPGRSAVGGDAPQTTEILDAFGGENRYMELAIAGTPQGTITPEPITPRQRIVTAPYAIHAHQADVAGQAERASSLQSSLTEVEPAVVLNTAQKRVEVKSDQLSVLGDIYNRNFAEPVTIADELVVERDLTAEANVGIGTTAGPKTRLDLGSELLHSDTVSRVVSDYQVALSAYVSATHHVSHNLAFAAGNDVVGAISAVDEGPAAATGLGIFTGSNTALVERVRVASNGDVGIGTDTPSAKLEVAGNVKVLSDGGVTIKGDSPALYLADEGAANPTTFTLYNDEGFGVWQEDGDAGNGNRFFISEASGNVGIRTTTPSAKLEVAGDLKVSGTISISSAFLGAVTNVKSYIEEGVESYTAGKNGLLFGIMSTVSGEYKLGLVLANTTETNSVAWCYGNGQRNFCIPMAKGDKVAMIQGGPAGDASFQGESTFFFRPFGN